MQLTDEVAEEVMREAARAKLERCLGTALQNVKTRTKKSDFAPAVQVCPQTHDHKQCVPGVLTLTSKDISSILPLTKNRVSKTSAEQPLYMPASWCSQKETVELKESATIACSAVMVMTHCLCVVTACI